jgi:hypothetical protein
MRRRIVLFAVLVLVACKRAPKSEVVVDLPNPSYFPTCAAIDESGIYWTASGHVFHARASAAAAVEDFVTTADGAPGAIAVDATNVYWIDNRTRAVMRKSKSGGAATPVAVLAGSPMDSCSIAMDGSALYAGTTPAAVDTLVKIDTGSGAMTEVARDVHLRDGIVVSGDYVYFTAGSRVRRVAKNGGPANVANVNTVDERLDSSPVDQACAASAVHGSRGLAVVGDTAYYLAKGGCLYAVPTTGGVPAVRATPADHNGWRTLAATADGASILAVSDTGVSAVDLKKGETRLLTSESAAWAGAWVGVHAGHVYWAQATALRRIAR